MTTIINNDIRSSYFIDDFIKKFWICLFATKCFYLRFFKYSFLIMVKCIYSYFVTKVFFPRIILPISRSEYANYPNKSQQGFTTTFWFDRLLSPTITLWPVPDGTSAQYLKYYRVRQIQDSNFTSGQTYIIDRTPPTVSRSAQCQT